MAKYDLESLLNGLKNICVEGLNPKLDAISTEKGGEEPLPHIEENAYFFQAMDKKAAGIHRVFLFYGAEDPLADGIGPHTLEDYSIFFIVVLRDTADGEALTTKLLRYSRALKEIFEEASLKNKVRSRISVTSLSPVNFGIQDVPGTFRGVGVKIGATIG